MNILFAVCVGFVVFATYTTRPMFSPVRLNPGESLAHTLMSLLVFVAAVVASMTFISILGALVS